MPEALGAISRRGSRPLFVRDVQGLDAGGVAGRKIGRVLRVTADSAGVSLSALLLRTALAWFAPRPAGLKCSHRFYAPLFTAGSSKILRIASMFARHSQTRVFICGSARWLARSVGRSTTCPYSNGRLAHLRLSPEVNRRLLSAPVKSRVLRKPRRQPSKAFRGRPSEPYRNIDALGW
jgi:hypothetical protein